MSTTWKRCSTCKKDIPFKGTYYECSVSTCTRKRTGFRFCSVECWEQHLPLMRHREAWAVEETAPTQAEFAAEQASAASKSGGGSSGVKKPPPRVGTPAAPAPSVRRRVVPTRQPEAAPEPAGRAPSKDAPLEVLVVASRLKNYIRAKHDMNTSDGVLEPLSAKLRLLANRAARIAAEDGRKTILERDFDFLKE